MEIVAPDVKNDLKSLDATSFSKKHGKSKSEIKNTFESAEEKVPEPGREAVGGRFTSRPPKSVMKPAPQVTSEQVELEETMSNDDKSSIALKALVAKKNLKQSEGKVKSVPFLVKMKQRVAAGKKLKEEVEELEEMDKSQDPPGRDGGIQFPPGPKVSKKDIKAVKKDPAKHLSDLFAKEYAKKKMKEEVGQIDENSPTHIVYFRHPTLAKMRGIEVNANDENDAHKKAYKKLKELEPFHHKNMKDYDVEKLSEEVEQIDELAPKTLASYTAKASHDVSKRSEKVGFSKGASTGRHRFWDTDKTGEHDPKIAKRKKGIGKAVGRLANLTNQKKANEEVVAEGESDKEFQARQERLAASHKETQKDPKRLARLMKIPGYADAMKLAQKTTHKQGVAEALIGGQKKLDKNHNNKLDAQDFAILRGKKKVQEDHEYADGEMSIHELKQIKAHVDWILEMLKPNTDMPEWVQAKITLAADYLSTACDYLHVELNEGTYSADVERDRKSTRLNSSHSQQSRMPSSA